MTFNFVCEYEPADETKPVQLLDVELYVRFDVRLDPHGVSPTFGSWRLLEAEVLTVHEHRSGLRLTGEQVPPTDELLKIFHATHLMNALERWMSQHED